MSTEKSIQHPAKHRKPLPRFEKILLIHENEVDFFIDEAILKEITLSKEIKREYSPADVINRLKNTLLLSDVPELIFLDIESEKKNGFSFLDEFRKLSDFIRNKCKIILIGGPEKSDAQKHALLNPSVIRYLIKPLDASQLKEFMFS